MTEASNIYVFPRVSFLAPASGLGERICYAFIVKALRGASYLAMGQIAKCRIFSFPDPVMLLPWQVKAQGGSPPYLASLPPFTEPFGDCSNMYPIIHSSLPISILYGEQHERSHPFIRRLRRYFAYTLSMFYSMERKRVRIYSYRCPSLGKPDPKHGRLGILPSKSLPTVHTVSRRFSDRHIVQHCTQLARGHFKAFWRAFRNFGLSAWTIIPGGLHFAGTGMDYGSRKTRTIKETRGE